MEPSDVPPYPYSSNQGPEGWENTYQRMAAGCMATPNGDPLKLFQAMEKLRSGDVDFDQHSLATGAGRAISVPLQKLDKCQVCSKTTDLRLCSSCASVIYCSRDCQKFAWRDHKRFCTQTQQINLKTFYPFIAYMFDSIRRIAPLQSQPLSPSVDPHLVSIFDKLGRRPGTGVANVHPALCHRILKAPTPGARKATPTENSLHHTVVLGEKYDLRIQKSLPDAQRLKHWWKGRTTVAAMQMYTHISRQDYILEITIAVSLILLSEVYSTHMTKVAGEYGETKWEPRSCFRLEYGHSPVSDFGICRGRIQGKANRVQTWTYYEPKSNTRTAVLDPDRHYWLYFRTIKGEELVLDCCSFSFGMEGCVDAAECLRNLAVMFRQYGSARTPAYLYCPGRPEECPNTHTLVEEQRFSVMHNTSLYGALGWALFGGKDQDQHAIIHDFASKVQGKECTHDQEDRIRDYRSFGAIMLGQVLSGKFWKDWTKATLHPRDNCFDAKQPKEEVWVKGSPEDSSYNGKLNGMLGLFGDVLGIRD